MKKTKNVIGVVVLLKYMTQRDKDIKSMEDKNQKEKDRLVNQYDNEIKRMKGQLRDLRNKIYETLYKKFEIQYPKL